MTKQKLSSPLTEMLAIQSPILSAPMAGVSGARLALAVSAAGGLGFIGAGYGYRDWLAEQLSICQGKAFGVGFISWSLLEQSYLLNMALDARPRAIFLSFGDIAPFASMVLNARVKLIAQVQTVSQAREAVAQGAQVIVAQGGEAGGHGGMRGTMALVPAVVDAVSPVPVVAAGGIADGRGLAAALMLGASGALCGTAFYASSESMANIQAKKRLLDAGGDDTVKSPVFDIVRGLEWPEGPWQLRTLRNRFSSRWQADLDALRESLPEHRKVYADAQKHNNYSVAAVIAGEVADLVKSIEPAEKIVRRIHEECARLLGGAGDRLR